MNSGHTTEVVATSEASGFGRHKARHEFCRHCSSITMNEVILDMVEEHFLKRNTISAFKWASLAQQLDLNSGYVNRYMEAYCINLTALMIHHNGDCNWYRVLGINNTLSLVRPLHINS
ncbi:hypothetical protein LWI29_004124 [Acer saccharum]|uniref:Uncharacterized protein n=1 Tax=Acer saccharum TaxID=4024 RepID=A0AA39RBQ0_ACESA|nr:hypothetical protein LWI29_004124 [Acer saccharum]